MIADTSKLKASTLAAFARGEMSGAQDKALPRLFFV